MDPFIIIVFVILILLSAFFSGTELALMSLPEHKIDSLLKQNRYGAKSLKKIRKNKDRLLIVLLVGNNLVNVYTASLATTIAISLAEYYNLAQATILGVSTGIITLLLLLFGEIIPKSFATKNAKNISLLVAPIYKFLMFILYPLVSFIEIIIKIFTGKAKTEIITDDEIESFIDMGKNLGSIDDKEHEQIKSILEFDETTVDEIMTPRVKIEAISIKSTVKQAMEFYLSHTHSRIPLYGDTIDKIDYFLLSRDLIKEYIQGNLDMKVSDMKLKEVLKVPLNQSISKLLETFQRSHKIMAIIIDEYGGVSGLITIEDIIEQVFGDIRDETDKETDDFIEKDDYTLIVESNVLIEDILKKFDIELEDIGLDDREFDGQTLSYLITHILEGFPVNGQVITFNIFDENNHDRKILSCKVLDINNAKIGQVEVKLLT